MLSTQPGLYPSKAPKGVYDTTILCQLCERKFLSPDTYADHIFNKCVNKFAVIEVNGQPDRYVLEEFRHKDLKRFFISVAWRASVSSRSFFDKVDLGDYEDVAKKAFLSDNFGDYNFFSVMIRRFSNHIGTAILDPYVEEILGVKFLRIYFADYTAFVKIDSKPAPDQFIPFILRDGLPLVMLVQDLATSSELSVILDVMQRGQNRRTRTTTLR